MNGQTAEEIEEIRNNSNLLVLDSLKEKYNDEFILEKQNALQYAADNGEDVYIQNENGSIDELMKVTADGELIYYSTENVNAAKSSRADHLNSGGSLGLNLNGQGVTAYVWDGGPVRSTHQEYGGRVIIGDGATSLNGNSFHSTHVTGTISAAGINPLSKGMANQSNVNANDWNNDLFEATNAAGNGMLLSNHSYGWASQSVPDWWFGAYTSHSRNWDNVMYNAPYYLQVKSAGNDGSNSTFNALPLNGNSAYDKLTPFTTSKNNLVRSFPDETPSLINAEVFFITASALAIKAS